jgi:hypothetical protein
MADLDCQLGSQRSIRCRLPLTDRRLYEGLREIYASMPWQQEPIHDLQRLRKEGATAPTAAQREYVVWRRRELCVASGMFESVRGKRNTVAQVGWEYTRHLRREIRPYRQSSLLTAIRRYSVRYKRSDQGP